MKDTHGPAKRLTLRPGDAWWSLGNDPQVLLLLDTSDYTLMFVILVEYASQWADVIAGEQLQLQKCIIFYILKV